MTGKHQKTNAKNRRTEEKQITHEGKSLIAHKVAQRARAREQARYTNLNFLAQLIATGGVRHHLDDATLHRAKNKIKF